MRELIQSVHLGLGASSKRKVYIVDEVHMLSAAASNTLLKTLEEPPPHVVFVLATTDPQKVLPTIRSRTQHFEFTLLTREQLIGHLADILGREGIEADPEVLDLIARKAAGSARDALSVLDQALAVGGGALDGAAVQSALGGAPFELRHSVLDAVAAEDVAGALTGIHNLLAQGHDVRRVADDLLRTLRDAFMAANAGGRVPYDGPAEEAAQLAALAQAMGNVARGARASRSWAKRSSTCASRRSPIRASCSRSRSCASRAAKRATSVETLLERVERLERALAAGGAAPVASARGSRAAARGGGGVPFRARWSRRAPRPRRRRARPTRPPNPQSNRNPLHPRPTTFDPDDVIEAWPAVLESLKAPLRAAIQHAQPIGVENGVVVFGVPRQRFDAINGRFRSDADVIKDAFAARLGFQPRFMLRPHDFDAPDALRPVGRRDRPSRRRQPCGRRGRRSADRPVGTRRRRRRAAVGFGGASCQRPRGRGRRGTPPRLGGATVANQQQMKMLRQIQQMQEDMAAAQAALADATVEATAGGGVVKATVTGEGDFRRDLDRPERRRSRRHRDARRSRGRRGPRSRAPSPRTPAGEDGCGDGRDRHERARRIGRSARLMAVYEGVVQTLIDELGRLPGIGPKSAQRIAFYLLKAAPEDARRLANSITEAKERVSWCRQCYNLAEGELCTFCRDEQARSPRACASSRSPATSLRSSAPASSAAATTCSRARSRRSKGSDRSSSA